MALVKSLRLLSVFSLAILNISFEALPANALTVDRGHIGRSPNHPHAGIAKKRGSSPRKCKPRATSAPTSSLSDHVAVVTTTSLMTTTSPQPTASTTASSSGSTKPGLAWSNPEEQSLHNFITEHTKYIYNWQLSYGGVKDVAQVSDALQQGDGKPLFTYNEPEIESQCNMSPEQGYTLWNQYILPAADRGWKLFAPSITSSPEGLTWITTFMKLCNGACKIEKMNLHYYGTEVQSLISFASQLHKAFGRPIWVTEIGCVYYGGDGPSTCSQDTFNTFYDAAIGFMEDTDYIENYFWFGMFTEAQLPNGVDPVNAMIDCPNGNDLSTCVPNALGNRYLNP
ncbi:glycosyl hydrolase catalytic core-domain-containing protein [Russula compacta]|nr:glycosyl hydrolase catalytic core-domain-containing protein [Russula compacta]